MQLSIHLAHLFVYVSPVVIPVTYCVLVCECLRSAHIKIVLAIEALFTLYLRLLVAMS